MRLMLGQVRHFGYAYEKLGNALREMVPAIERVAQEFAANKRGDDRTLFVILACPCCCGDAVPSDLPENTILVSPFKGIDCDNLKVTRMKIYPPHNKKDGVAEARDEAQFAECWRQTLEEATMAPA